MASKEIFSLAKKIWNYHKMNHKLKKADCILVLGSRDIRVAKRGAQLFLDCVAPLIIFSGGKGKLTKKWKNSEAEEFAKIALKMGVPEEKIIREDRSSNTGENIIFTKKILEDRGFYPQSVLLVSKPYMERRAYATFKKLWPNMSVVVTSPQISFEKYANKEILIDDVISIMVGDLERIKEYPAQGFQIRQKIPQDVSSAYKKLIGFGYTKHLIKK